MQEQSNTIRIKRKTICYVAVLLVTMIGVTPALAEYLGPHRTVTETTTVCKVILNECQYVDAKDTWKYTTQATWPCSSESKPWRDYPGNSRTCNSGNNGYQYWERVDVPQTVTNTYPPATIDGILQNCTLQNGWCITAPQLALNGIEPVAGYSVTAIEGSWNGQNFACTGSSCNVPLSQGNNNFSYWAFSTFGDTSTMGSLTAKVDSQPPILTGTLTGVSGSNGWYLSPVTFITSAYDVTAGLAVLTCTLDNVALGSCSTIPINGEGPHTLFLYTYDNAGLTRTLTQNTSIDTQNPVLNASIQGMQGSNNWYTAASLNASASDPEPGSGLSLFEYRFDNGNWGNFPSSGTLELSEGKHTVDLRTIDKAGHTVSSSKSFWLDTVAPSLTMDASGSIGSNDWYTTHPVISASTHDDTSGMDRFEYNLDHNSWELYTAPLTLSEGTHELSFWAQDEAGLVTQQERTYQVDTRAPQIGGNLSAVMGANNWYVSEVTLSAAASDPTPGSGLDFFGYSLDGGETIPYTDTLALSDGQHRIQLQAQDQAGHVYAIEQAFQVDTIPPELNIVTTLPSWNKGNITLEGDVSDKGSGTSIVEISVDGEQTWQTITGTDSWNYLWNTSDSPNGIHQVSLRATDLAGLATQRTVAIGVDNEAPKISVPDSWFQWDTVTLDIWDEDSGLSEARVEITDPEGRWPNRVIQLDPEQFPLSFKWDRRFGDDTVADAGTYDLKISAIDKVGNETKTNASIRVLLDILPPGPTATSQPTHEPATIAPTSTVPESLSPTPVSTEFSSFPTITITPKPTQTPVVSVFGVIDPVIQATSTPVITLTPRATPTQVTTFDWLQSILAPVPTQVSITNIGPTSESDKSPQPAGAESNVLWGTAATAAIGAAMAYAEEEKRKREEEKARLAALEEQEEERREKAKERHMEKMEEKRAQEQAWAEAREEARQQEAERDSHIQIDRKMDRIEAEEQTKRLIAQEEVREARKQAEEKKKEEQIKEGLAAYYEATHPAEKETPSKPSTPSNWWEKTKAFVSENIIEPVNTYIYQPYIKPAIEFRNEVNANIVSWLDEKIYEPVISPAIERTKDFISNETAWINENIYQPVIKPVVNKVSETVKQGVSWVNQNIYQPVIKPVVNKVSEAVKQGISWVNQNIYEPHIQPVVEKTKEFISTETAWIDENIYQPFIAPVVETVKENIYEPYFEPVISDIDQYIYQPLADKVSNWWDQYGEWVHQGLDLAGVIPGFGEFADGINAVIYLAEGRYVEATVSVLSLLPLLGDLGKLEKFGQEALDTVVKGVAGELIEKAAKESVEEIAEFGMKQAGTELVENAWAHELLNALGFIPDASPITSKIDSLIYLVEGHYLDATVSVLSTVPVVGDLAKIGKEAIEDSFERLVKEATEQLQEKLLKESMEEAGEEVIEKVSKETLEELTEDTVKEIGEESLETATKEVLEEAGENAAYEIVEESAQEVSEKILVETGEEFVEQTTKEALETTIEETAKEVSADAIENVSHVFSEKTVERIPDQLLDQVVSNTAVEETIEEALEQVSQETTQRVLKEVTEGKVTKLPADIAEQLTDENAKELAKKISDELGGKKVWVSAKTGSVYVSSPPAEGFLLAEQLSKTDLTKTDEVEKILHRVAELTSRGSGDHVVLGPFKPDGTFIQAALDTDGVFWDVGDELWESLENTGVDMFKANDQFLRVQIENRIDRFDVINTNVNKVISDFNNNTPIDWTKIKYTEKEILDLASTPNIPYQLVDNSWVRLDLIKSMD